MDIRPEKRFDLEKRTFEFALKVRKLLKSPFLSSAETDDKRQLGRSSGSVAANYMEANEALSRKDFFLRIRICRKEARESHMWLRIIKEDGDHTSEELERLIDEAIQLVKIFNAIAQKDRGN